MYLYIYINLYHIYPPMISISHVYYYSLTLGEKIIQPRSYSGCHSSSTHLCRVHKGSQAFQAILATIPQLFFQETNVFEEKEQDRNKGQTSNLRCLFVFSGALGGEKLSGWWFQPIFQKICSSKWTISPNWQRKFKNN